MLAREKAQAELAEAVNARDEFIAVAAHELRNPLNVFHLTLQLLYRVSSDPSGFPQIRGLLEKTRIQLGRLTTSVDRLLDVTRIRAGRFELYRETFDLSSVIREVVSRFANEHPNIPTSLCGCPEFVDTRVRLVLSHGCRFFEKSSPARACAERCPAMSSAWGRQVAGKRSTGFSACLMARRSNSVGHK